MTGRTAAAKPLVCALEAAVLSTGFAPNLAVLLPNIATSISVERSVVGETSVPETIIGAIAALIVDTTMVVMTSTRMITTILAAMRRVMGRRLRRGGIGGGTIKVELPRHDGVVIVPCLVYY